MKEENKIMHECLLCKRDMKVSNNVFGNGCMRNIYAFLDLNIPRKDNNILYYYEYER